MHESLRHAHNSLRAAEKSIEEMEGSETFDEFEQHWRDFLNHLEKSWVKIERGCQQYRAKFEPWQSKYKKEKRGDLLLKYLKAARDADNHSIQDLAKMETGPTHINFANSSSGTIKSMHILNGEIVEYSGDPIVAVQQPMQPIAVRFKNNGSWFNPPAYHKQRRLESSHPAFLAHVGLAWHKAFMKDVEDTFFS